MKIEIIYDRTRQLDPDDAVIYADESDYFDAYTYLQAAIKQNIDKRVILRSLPLKIWLVKGLKKYKRAEIAEKEITFGSLLANKWKIKWDIDISDDEIVRDNLLALPVEGTEKQNLSDFICEHFISPHLKTSHFNRLQFGELMTDLIRFQAHKKERPQIAGTVFQYRLDKWLENSPEFKKLIRCLAENLSELYNKACLFKLTAAYPQTLQTKCLGNNWRGLLKKAGLNLEHLKTDHFEKTKDYSTILINELNLFYNHIKRHPADIDQDTVYELIKYSSGRVGEELEHLFEILKLKPELIDEACIRVIKSAFTTLLPVYGPQIENIRDYIQPPKPTSFLRNCESLENVVKWAVNEYLPYKFWLEKTRNSDNKILSYGNDFSEYILKQYSQISYHHTNFTHRFIFNHKERIAQTPVPILLVLDNFNYKFLNLLRFYFSRHKIIPRTVEPYLTLLPTETSMAKAALLSGHRNKTENKHRDYFKMLVSQWQNYFPEHKITYVSKPGILNEHRISGKEFLVINYLEIDNELHKSSQKTAIEHRKSVAFIIEHITELIADFIRRNHLEAKVKIFFASDHGSTLIAKGVENEIDTSYFKEIATDYDYRYISLNEKTFQAIRKNQNISHAVFPLDKTISGDGKNYVIARGYNRFKNLHDEFYVHGGALPEEIIVPAGYFVYSVTDSKPIIIQLIKNEYRLKVKETIILRIANPNDMPAENIHIDVLADGLTLAETEEKFLKGQTEVERSEMIRITGRHTDMLEVIVHYEISGRLLKDTFEFPVKIKTFSTTKFDFDEF
jgi:hypothetical protein